MVSWSVVGRPVGQLASLVLRHQSENLQAGQQVKVFVYLVLVRVVVMSYYRTVGSTLSVRVTVGDALVVILPFMGHLLPILHSHSVVEWDTF